MDQFPIDGLLRVSQICGDRKRGIPAIVPVSRSTWWAGVASGRFPQPVRLGSKLTFWKAADIRALVAKLSGVPA
ncbi:MAG TPA: AlpA family phage regulatory protein [Candidatus Ozemobacteraceae bacterium]|nr:AlpA family phage regulatory protein [Candidatus Ozemobacteraceae bacterium]